MKLKSWMKKNTRTRNGLAHAQFKSLFGALETLKPVMCRESWSSTSIDRGSFSSNKTSSVFAGWGF